MKLEEALLDLAEALRGIQPDEVQINVPTRPPAEPWVEAPDNFRANEDEGYSHVFKQPENDEQETQCQEALESCLVEAIGDDGEEESGVLRRVRTHPRSAQRCR